MNLLLSCLNGVFIGVMAAIAGYNPSHWQFWVIAIIGNVLFALKGE